MRIIISSCIYHESVGNFLQADLNDRVLQKIAKTPEGESIVEKIDWINPSLRPGDIKRMESSIYEPDFHYYDVKIPPFFDLTTDQQRLVPKPVREKIYQEVNKLAEEELVYDNRDKYLVDGINGVFYFILSVRHSKKQIEVEDLTVVPGNRRTNLPIALERIYNLLMPYQSQGYTMKGSARKTTAWPMIKNLVRQGWLIPIEGKRIKKVYRDEQGKIIDMKTKMEEIGSEELHKFEFQMNLPPVLPDYIQKPAIEAYKKLYPEKSLLGRGLDKLKGFIGR